MDDSRFVDVAEPEEVFGVLSNEFRVAILRALWEAGDRMAAFSELREAVGNPDSGQFSYHLDELVGPFVTQTESGYELTQAGRQINGVIASGAYTIEGAIESITLDGPCRVCGGTQTLRYEDEVVRVECDACPSVSEFAVPPSIFAGYDREAIPRVANRYLWTRIRHITDGFCWLCDGRVRPTVAPANEVIDPGDIPPDDVPPAFAQRAENVPWVRFDCQQCDTNSEMGLGHVLLDHPGVAGFYYAHGVDVRERPVWSFPSVADDCLAVMGRDASRARVTYSADGDEITLVVNEELDIVDIDP